MKNRMMALAVAASLVVSGGCTKGYESQKSAGDMTVTLKADSYPLVKGDNALTITAVDPAGKAVTDAKVNVRFYMPPMPGMAPMDSTTQALARGDQYKATVNAPMEGGWKAEVSLERPGKDPVTATYNLDAR